MKRNAVEDKNEQLNPKPRVAKNKIFHFQFQTCRDWKVSESESASIGKCQNRKVSELESVRIGKCQNQKVSELESFRIRKCQNWKVSES